MIRFQPRAGTLLCRSRCSTNKRRASGGRQCRWRVEKADAPDYGDENIVARATLAELDLATGNWRTTSFSANN